MMITNVGPTHIGVTVDHDPHDIEGAEQTARGTIRPSVGPVHVVRMTIEDHGWCWAPVDLCVCDPGTQWRYRFRFVREDAA